MVLPLFIAAGGAVRAVAGVGDMFDATGIPNATARGVNFLGSAGLRAGGLGISMFLGPVFGFFKWLVRGVIRIVGALVKMVINAVVAAVRFAVRQVVMRTTSDLRRDHPMWDLFITKHINWKRALTSLEDADAERERLTEELGDADGNGIPDLYDQEVTRPEDDFLGIKYPPYLFVENDYIRYLPRNPFVEIPQPVNVGAKGLVRSEGITSTGHYCVIKWNELNPYGPQEAPLYWCNSMDLYPLGHVYGAHLTR